MTRAIVLRRTQLFGVQRRALADDEGVEVDLAGVGGGKSDVGAIWFHRMVQEFPRRPNGSPSVGAIVGRDLLLVRQVQFEKVIEYARKLDAPLEAIFKGGMAGVKAGSEPRIHFANGVIAHGFHSRDPDRMAGHELDWVWIDEGDLQPEKVFVMALERQRAGRSPRIRVTSSPRVSGWIRSIVMGADKRWDALKKTKCLRAARWRSRDNPHLSPAQLAIIRAGLEANDPGQSAQELDGLFLGTDEAPGVKGMQFARAFVGRVPLSREDAVPHVIGLDIGETVDFTWVTVLSAGGVILGMYRFNAGSPGVPRATFYNYLEEEVVRATHAWGVTLIACDTAKAGGPIAANLRKSARVEVLGVSTDAPGRKAQLLEALSVSLASDGVRVPSAWSAPGQPERVVQHVEQLRKEFSELESRESKAGKRYWDHPRGGHDDGVVSLALALHGLQERPRRRLRVERGRTGGGDTDRIERDW